MTLSPTDKPIGTAIDDAIYNVLGGVRAAATTLGVSTQALYQHLGRGYVADRETALLYEQATVAAGRRVPASQLMGLEPWTGPDPDRPKGSRPDVQPGDTAATGVPAPENAPTTNVTPISAFVRPGCRVRPPRPSSARCTASQAPWMRSAA